MGTEEPKWKRTDNTVTKRIDGKLYGRVLELRDTLKESEDKTNRAVTSSETAFISYLIDMGIDSAMHNRKMKQVFNTNVIRKSKCINCGRDIELRNEWGKQEWYHSYDITTNMIPNKTCDMMDTGKKEIDWTRVATPEDEVK